VENAIANASKNNPTESVRCRDERRQCSESAKRKCHHINWPVGRKLIEKPCIEMFVSIGIVGFLGIAVT
jgi:hypothetical protein